MYLNEKYRRKYKMNKLTGTILASGMLLMSSHAATIDWTTNAITGFATDVITNGVTVVAINAVGDGVTTSPTINGVTFTADETILAGSYTSDPWTSVVDDAAYDQMLSSIDFEEAAAVTTTLSDLTVGAEYLIQYWYADSDWTSKDRIMTFNGTGETALNGVSYAVGTFTADATTQDLVISASQNGPRLTGFQLRGLSGHVPAPVLELSATKLLFGSVLVGETNSLTVTVKNTGGGSLDGTASIAAPFTIASGATYSLSNNQEQVVSVLFVPQTVGEVTNTLSFTGGDGASIDVSGTGGSALGTLVADIAGDYAGSADVPAGWEYLYSDLASGGTEVSMTAAQSVGDVGNTGFEGLNDSIILGSHTSDQYEIYSDGFDGSGTAAKNSATGNEGVVGTDLLLAPGSSTSDAFVIVRYTISAADVQNGSAVTIAGSFRNLVVRNTSNAASQGSVDVFVYHNSDPVFSVDQADDAATACLLSQSNGTFNITGLTVAEGDTISFVVGNNGNNARDESALTGKIWVEETTDPILIPGVEVVDGNIEFQFSGAIGSHYTVESTEALAPSDWKTVQDVNPLSESPMDISIPTTNASAFYRIIYIP
jgi:hypothetical protein